MPTDTAKQLKNAYVDTADSPAGPITFAVDDSGALVWTEFVEGHYEHSMAEILTGEGYRLTADAGKTAAAREQLQQYAEGQRQTFDLPLLLIGSEWQKTVWRVLQTIPYGETRSYGELAAMLGRPGAARAVGSANGSNRLPLVIPCHRVIGADGSLTGYGGGLDLKVRLLEHEGAITGTRPGSGERAAQRRMAELG